MPAIQPARLKQQAALLAEAYEQPQNFLRSLHHLMEAYADRAHRPGQAGKPPPLLSAYHVRPPVLRQILHELAAQAREDPAPAFVLCDALWAEPVLEFRLLAAALIGRLPVTPPEPVLDTIQAWLSSRPEERILATLINQGLERMRAEQPERMLAQIESWLASPEPFLRQVGLRALQPVVANPDFKNLPFLFRLVSPMVRVAPSGLRPYLLDVVEALAQRSPQETAFFLRQCLETPESPDAPWVIRQVFRSIPADLQDDLRQAMRGE